jgi:hypothetical protein
MNIWWHESSDDSYPDKDLPDQSWHTCDWGYLIICTSSPPYPSTCLIQTFNFLNTFMKFLISKLQRIFFPFDVMAASFVTIIALLAQQYKDHTLCSQLCPRCLINFSKSWQGARFWMLSPPATPASGNSQLDLAIHTPERIHDPELLKGEGYHG